MGLLDKASLVITPNGYKAGKLYSVIPNTSLGDMDVVRATTATRVNSAGVVEAVGINVPRIDYTGGGCPSLLVEPQRTNLILHSNNLTNAAWTKNGATIALNNSISPEWILNASTVTFTGGGQIVSQTALTIGTNVSISVFLKGISGETINIFNGRTDILITLTNDWKRFTLNNINTTSSSINLNTFSGATARVFQIYGFQVELGVFATSYIPTVATSVTRNADVISKTGISSLIGQTEGTIFAEIKVSKLLGVQSRYILNTSDGTANNRIYIGFSSESSNIIRARIFNGGVLQASVESSAITTTGTYKLALAYNNNDVVFFINGVQIGVDASATIPACSQINVGQNQINASQFNDSVAGAILFKTRLSNLELTSLTTL